MYTRSLCAVNLVILHCNSGSKHSNMYIVHRILLALKKLYRNITIPAAVALDLLEALLVTPLSFEGT